MYLGMDIFIYQSIYLYIPLYRFLYTFIYIICTSMARAGGVVARCNIYVYMYIYIYRCIQIYIYIYICISINQSIYAYICTSIFVNNYMFRCLPLWQWRAAWRRDATARSGTEPSRRYRGGQRLQPE